MNYYNQSITGVAQGYEEKAVAQIQQAAPIRSAIERTDKSLAELAAVISALDQRLAFVLRPVPPSNGVDPAGQPRPVAAPMTDTLESVNARVEACIAHVTHIHSRLEL
jgi:hypothetical protein